MDKIIPAALEAALRGDFKNFIVASTPRGIEQQEAQGQRDLVNSQRLPREIMDYFFRGESAQEVYARVGIEIIDEADDIFLNVRLPNGWKLSPTEHSMWSDLLDEKGRKRAAIFYKAAFYDRSAHFNFVPRFHVRVEPEDGYKSKASYEEREKMQRFGRVFDGDTLVFETTGRPAVTVESGKPETWNARDKQEEEIAAECRVWLEEKGYPNYKDPLRYWD